MHSDFGMGFSDSMDSAGEEFQIVGKSKKQGSKRTRERHSRSSTGSDGELQRPKIRRDGEFVVIVKLKGTGTTLNKIQLAEHLVKDIGNFQYAKSLANGRILVVCHSKSQQERALAITSLNKCDVEVYAPGTGSKTKGVIYGVPTELSDEDILGKAKGAEVSEVKRFQITKDNMRVASQTVLLTFESESIPRRIEIGYLIFQVKPYIRPPLRCFNCHTYGHVAAVCRKKRKCGKCGGDHNYEDCASALCCPNCGEAHSAGFKGCRFYANAVEVQKIRTYERVSYAEAVKRVGHANRPSQQPARIFTPPSDSLIIKKTDFLAFITDVLTGLKFSKVVKKSDVIRIVSLSAAKYLQILNGRTICCGEKASLSNCSSMVSMEGCLAGLRISWKIELSSMLPFAVVEFSNHGLAVIATKLFTGPEEDECYWPPAKMNSTRAAIKQKDPCTDWVTHEVTVKRKAATYEIARSKLVEYEQNTDVSTEPESTENMGRGKRKRRQVVMSSEAEDEDDDDINNQASPSPLRPPSTLRCMQTPLLPPTGLCRPPSTHPQVSADPSTHPQVYTDSCTPCSHPRVFNPKTRHSG
ncbi:uncharacterized protein LOC132889552 isoform X3 [Neoarius graeffei]|uniref:uncharacterized protein LOC132889552 isoform X3 n=1 Tax=Neoarius graeffei TaxID=443677 RepID=UPI00298D19B7|nr:uncharacterized protein LOC132889552 isoform X3 [Neoarius graeffei]